MPLRLVPDNTNLPFMSWVRIRTPISLVLVALSFILFFTIGVNRGIDFVAAAAGMGTATGGVPRPIRRKTPSTM